MDIYIISLLFAIPIFIILIGLEAFVAFRRGIRVNRAADMISSLSSGLTNTTRDGIQFGFIIISYTWLVDHITIFKVEGYQVLYTINAPVALFDGTQWDAQDATIKTHVYENGKLKKYTVEHKKSIKTLEGYKPKIIESLYEGKALNIIDAFNTWKLLKKQNLNSDKIRAAFYNKIVVPLFAIALLLILFFKIPFHARMMNLGSVIALSMGTTFVIWGILFGLNQMGSNGVLIPELTAILPISLLWVFAIYVYFTDEKSIA